MIFAFPIGVDKTVKEMAEKLNAPALQTVNVSTANFTESPKYACFELVFGSDRDEDEASVCRKPQNMPTTIAKKTCVRISPTLSSLQQKQIRAQERRKKRIERKVAKAKAQQEHVQKLTNVGAKLRHDGSAKRNHSESSDSCSSEEKENVSSSTHLAACGSDRNVHVQHAAVAFEIPAGTPGSCRKSLPKRLCNQTQISRSITIESLKEKQHMAERRKKQQEEARLKRIKERQESARKLAENVEILLEQRVLATGQKQTHAQKMTSKEIMDTARRVALHFNSLSNQMRKDFAVETKQNKTKACENNNVKPKPNSMEHHNDKSSENSWQNTGEATCNLPRSTSAGVAFSIDLDPDKGRNAPSPKKLTSPCKTKKGSSLTAWDVEEKLMKAEERRNKRREEKVRRVRANREALLKLSSNIQTFMNNEEESPNKHKLSRQEVAHLANEIANGFDRLSERYKNDLKRAENFPTMSFLYMP